MSFHPAGAEDSDSDDEGFYMGSSYSVNTDRDKRSMNGDINLNSTVHSQKNLAAMPAGAESDEDSEGLEFHSAPVNAFPPSSARSDGRKKFDRQREKAYKTNDGPSYIMPGASGLGRGRGQLQQKGRGRGGFPRPPPSYTNREKTARRLVYY